MLSDIEICQKATLHNINDIAISMGLTPTEFTSLGSTKAKLSLKSLQRLKNKRDGKLILVTAITPTPLGEGKTVTTIGLAQGLAKLSVNVAACIRQPSMGPVFGVKGGAAGGGYSQVAPMEELNLHLTGDIHAVTAAHNLASAALDARIFHEQKHGYDAFESNTGLKAVRIDSSKVVWRRVMDHNDRSLRMVTIGKNKPGKTVNGFQREEGFDISAASELMAILALASDLHDLRERIGRIVLAYDVSGLPITTEDLNVAGAMTVTMRETIEPTLMQTLEGVPTLVHAGPFANIAHGNSSIIADKLALKISDYTVTEAGFGSDMGFEKACNIKANASGKVPDCAVIVATLRGLKANSGLYDLIPGQPLPNALFEKNEQALTTGFKNLVWHINNVIRYGIPAVVAINRFPQDSDEELTELKGWINQLDLPVSVEISDAFSLGGDGAVKLAQQVISTCNSTIDFKPLYKLKDTLEEKLMAVCEVGYGADQIVLSTQAKKQLSNYKKLGFDHLSVCVAKTPQSISTDPTLKNVPTHFDVHINELKLCAGAGFVYALTQNVMTMPGLPERPAFMNIDIDDDGNVIGLS